MAINKNAIGFFLFFLSIGVFAQEVTHFEGNYFIKKSDTLPYQISYPDNFNPDETYPLVLFLHGAGERGNDNQKQLSNGAALFSDETNRSNYPAIVIFPQCPQNDYWANVAVDRSNYPIKLSSRYDSGPTKAMGLVIDLLQQTLTESYIDKSKVYVMGLSMGGMGTFELIARKPDIFAAAIPICGAGSTPTVSNFAKEVPIWAFHGAKDNVVAPQESLKMITEIVDQGGFPRFNIYENANHNSWDQAFAEPDLLRWLFSHSLTQ